MKPLQAVVLRLFSLLALAAGVVMLGLAIPITQVQDTWAQTLEQLPADWRLLGFVAGGVLVVFGLFGLLPLGIRRGKSVAFDGEHGQIIIQLDPVERKLNKVLNKMPEVRKIRAVVVPDKQGGPAQIHARAWLRRLPEQRARDIEMRVADYIEETATDFLGLEARTPVQLVVEDIAINIDEAAKELQRHSQERKDARELNQVLSADTPAPTAAQAAGVAAAVAAAAIVHESADTESSGNDDSSGELHMTTVDEEEGYVGVPASLNLEDGGVYSPEVTGAAVAEYVIGSSNGEITASHEDLEEDAGAESSNAEEATGDDGIPAVTLEDEPEEPEQDAVQIEYTLTTPGEPEDELPAAPTASVPMDEDVETAEEYAEEGGAAVEPESSAADDLPASTLEDYDTPLPPLEEVGPEEDSPYNYGITTESDAEEDLQGLPPLGEITPDEDTPTDDIDETKQNEDRWRF
ncbi:MAG: hypothetical protein IT368_03805 [Candidatus Hydrogenedentes bacterium]|nr:hypothetical protein [Candidatus Hydrogenedentota bacterium]